VLVCLEAKAWSEAVDLPLLLSQTKHIWSLELFKVDVNSTTHDMAAKFGCCAQPKMDLIRTSTRFFYMSGRYELVDSPLLKLNKPIIIGSMVLAST
jgi:hypothetical protein